MAERSSRLLRPVTEEDFGEKHRTGLFSVPDFVERRAEQLRRQLQLSNAGARRSVKSGKPEDIAAAFENNPFMGMLGSTIIKVPIMNRAFGRVVSGVTQGEVKMIKNPTNKQAEVFRENLPNRNRGTKTLRAIRDPQTKDVFMWDSMAATHDDAARGLGIDFGRFFRRMREDRAMGGQEMALPELKSAEEVRKFLAAPKR